MKETGKLNALWDKVLDQKKDINGMTGKIQGKVYRLVNILHEC